MQSQLYSHWTWFINFTVIFVSANISKILISNKQRRRYLEEMIHKAWYYAFLFLPEATDPKTNMPWNEMAQY